MRILQTSDVHLGPRAREPNGLLHHDECVCPIDVVRAAAEEHDVDVILIVGDLFEHARVSRELVTETFGRLGRMPVEVALVPGNHDVYDESTVYRRQRDDLEASGVRFFDDPAGQAFDFADDRLRIWARAMQDHSPRFTPLTDVPPHPGDRWYIAAAHGHFVASSTNDQHRSSRISTHDLEQSSADYVALGHWHVTTDLASRGVSKPAWYSGAPMFGHGAGRMLLVDLVPGSAPRVTPFDVLDHAASSCGP